MGPHRSRNRNMEAGAVQYATLVRDFPETHKWYLALTQKLNRQGTKSTRRLNHKATNWLIVTLLLQTTYKYCIYYFSASIIDENKTFSPHALQGVLSSPLQFFLYFIWGFHIIFFDNVITGC